MDQYYDIMIIGHTGQGKSTTSDKLLIANREGAQYTTDVNIVTDEAKKQLQCGDMTLWLTTTSDLEKEETRLKTLVFARTDANPHFQIKKIREDLGNPGTKHCEMFSNEVSKIRILDVPGFIDEECITGGPDTTVESALSNAIAYNLRIMRKIIHIQTVMNMKFKRILYFLPVRGPLERASGVLQLELRVLTHYFGSSVIRKIVIVATNPPRMGRMPEEEAFSNKDQVQTMKFVNRSLKKLFPDERFPLIPLIYISHGETCESILDKVFQAQVDCEDLQLQAYLDTCIQCGHLVSIVNKEKVVVYINRETKIPNSESHCHPKIVLDIRPRHKAANLFIKLTTLGLHSLKDYYVFDEICAGCRTAPGATRGCMQVGSAFVYDGETIIVDHKCNMLDAEEEFLGACLLAGDDLPLSSLTNLQLASSPRSLSSPVKEAHPRPLSSAVEEEANLQLASSPHPLSSPAKEAHLRPLSSLQRPVKKANLQLASSPCPLRRPAEEAHLLSNCPSTGESVVNDLTLPVLKKRIGVSDTQLDTELIDDDLYNLAACFDDVEPYLLKLKLSPCDQTDIRIIASRPDTQKAMTEALRRWRVPNPLDATFRALLTIVLDLKKGDVAIRVCSFMAEKVPQ